MEFEKLIMSRKKGMRTKTTEKKTSICDQALAYFALKLKSVKIRRIEGIVEILVTRSYRDTNQISIPNLHRFNKQKLQQHIYISRQ